MVTIQIPDDHLDPKDSQLILVITGTPEHIEERIKAMWVEMGWTGKAATIRKPNQGTVLRDNGTTTVITPIWEGKQY